MKTRTYLLLMLVTIIVPVACVAILGLSMLLQSERASRLRSIEEVAYSTSLLIDSEIASAEAAIRTIAHSEDIRSDNFARLHELLSSTRRSPLSWTLIADYDGNGLMNTLVPYGTPLAQHSGTWAAQVYDKQATVVGGYFVGARSKRGVVSVNVPAPRTAGKRYVVAQIFDPHYFDKVFGRSTVPPSWIIGMFGQKGIAIACNRSADSVVGKHVAADLFDASRRTATGRLKHTLADGAEVYDIYVRSALTGWTVTVQVPGAEIDSASRVTTWYAAATLFAVLGGAVAIAVYFGRRLDKSLNNATRAAEALAQGEVTPASRSKLKEANVLLGVLHRASVALAQERTARAGLEREREGLLERERAARRQAEAQSQAKDHFIAMLSHELRNPLAAISGAVSVLRLPQLPAAKADQAWAIVARQLHHLTRMVEDLLDVRRVSSGKVVLEKERVNIGSVLRLCCDARILAGVRRHEWHVTAQDAWVCGDRTRLEQIVDNLLTNAVKFSPPGAAITVKNSVVDDAVVIEVADTGVGIEADVLPTIFDSLVQGPTTIDRSQGGLGLGLSIARGLAQMHGGTITAHSDGLGKGAVFTVRLPLETAAMDAEPVA